MCVLRCRGRVEKGGAPWTQEVGVRKMGGSKGGGSKGGGSKGGGLEGGARRVGAQPRKSGGPKGGPKGGGPKGGGPKFRVFFPLPPQFSFPSLGIFSWNLGGVSDGPDPQLCTFGVLWLSCEAPAGEGNKSAKFWAVLGKGGPGEGRS